MYKISQNQIELDKNKKLIVESITSVGNWIKEGLAILAPSMAIFELFFQTNDATPAME